MNDLKILKTTIKMGLEKPIKFLHITDTHIFRDDTTGWNRKNAFDIDYDGCAEDYFFKAVEYAKENSLTIIHTGDLIDFFSDGNFEFLDKYFTDDIDYIYAVGNHDFVNFEDIKNGQEENKEYKNRQMGVIAPYIKNNLYFYSKIIGGVNIVTMDDSYYRISEEQIELLKAEAAKGYPILLCMHVPLYTPMLAASIDTTVLFVVGAPEEVLSTYSEDRRLQQKPDDATLRAIEYIKNEPLIKALITGHKHFNHQDKLDGGMIQYITHGSFAGYVREVTII